MRAQEMLILVLCIDVMFFFVNTAVIDINPDNSFYNYDDTIIKQADASAGAYQVVALNESDFPSGTNSVDPDTGAFFTDIFRSVRNWVFEQVPASQALYSAINAVPIFLNAVIGGSAPEFSFALGAMWHIFGVFTLVAFLWGRE